MGAREYEEVSRQVLATRRIDAWVGWLGFVCGHSVALAGDWVCYSWMIRATKG